MDLGSEKHVIQIWLGGQEDEKQGGYIVEARRREKQVDVHASRVWLHKDHGSEQNAHHAATPSTLSRRVGGPSDHE
jgi:hypothetical protein